MNKLRSSVHVGSTRHPAQRRATRIHPGRTHLADVPGLIACAGPRGPKPTAWTRTRPASQDGQLVTQQKVLEDEVLARTHQRLKTREEETGMADTGSALLIRARARFCRATGLTMPGRRLRLSHTASQTQELYAKSL